MSSFPSLILVLRLLNVLRITQGWGWEELRIFLQFLIVSRAHLSYGDPKLREMQQVQAGGVFEDSSLENRLNFLVVCHHLSDSEIPIDDVKPSTADERENKIISILLS